jgi:cytochrome c5
MHSGIRVKTLLVQLLAGLKTVLRGRMSDAHNKHHETAIRTPKQLIAAVAAAFLVPIITIVLIVQFVTHSKKYGAGSDSEKPEAVAERLKPVADQGFTLRDANAPKQLQSGAEVFKAVCSACHATGAAGAPKVGDTASWSPRIAQGYDTLVQHALHGIRAMPAKGGNPDLDDIEVARAVAYMADQAGAHFKEPEAKAAPATSNAAPAASAPAQPAPATATAAPSAAAPSSATPAPATTSADAGKKLFESTCQACHGMGIAGAPKFGDKAAWAPRLKEGKTTLYEHAIHGFQGKSGVMPPKGGSAASDEDVKAAVDYMAAAAK